MLFLYVDDNGVTGLSLPMILEVKEFLKSKFLMQDLGLAEYILGIQIVCNAQQQTMVLSQKAYFEQVLQCYGIEDCSPVKTSMEPGLKLELLPAGVTLFDCPYQSAIGSLMYGMLGTCPNLAFPVSYLARFTQASGPEHWTALKCVLCYSKGTLD